jgi:hypothetical protein
MARRKVRLTVTVDADLVAAGNRAARAGEVDSMSAWVNDALAQHEAKERLLRGMGEAIADYEAEFGVITDEEMAAQRRADRKSAIIVRGRGSLRRRGAGR